MGAFRDNNKNKNNNDDNKWYSKVIDKHLLKKYLVLKFMTLKIDLKGRLSFYD